MKISENSQNQFIDYVLDFYGKVWYISTSRFNNQHKFVERDDVLNALKNTKAFRCKIMNHLYN